jgi:hypothetical protein
MNNDRRAAIAETHTRQTPRAGTFNDTALYSLLMSEGRGWIEQFEKFITREKELPVAVHETYRALFEGVRDALHSVECAYCEKEPIAAIGEAGFMCALCRAEWVPCTGCGKEVRLAEAETPDGVEGYWHPYCYGPDETPDKDGE